MNNVYKWQVASFHFRAEKCIYGLPVVPGGPLSPPQQYLIPLKCIIADQRVCDALVWCVKDFFQQGVEKRKGEGTLHLQYHVPYLFASGW